MDSPNVLLLDEPTNDFDVETLTALEDLLDTYAGTLIVISHDRYFLERVCDRFVGLLGDEALRDLPGGVDQYLDLRSEMIAQSISAQPKKTISDAAQVRLIKKEIARLEKQIEKVSQEETALVAEQESAAFDHQRLIEVGDKLQSIQAQRQKLEEEWLELSDKISG
jgi:ATP-binding cassette subfamily F protein uup